ncbi:MAG: hypothetical protein EZS28_036943 [Streblomastix strix]|uniref:Uncharacterized protein n=1 Tax=Streblomastix strix TaxID=222440 RepID=A0A5J4UBD6_9EUKA|nr:MAG: hypothetical protein EZS28_036943 [Streblomastix strix]
MIIWMEDQENVAKLAIGDNLQMVNKQVIDYLWESTYLRALETELPDMSTDITILGTATGEDNAIIDLSFSGNTLVLAENSSFLSNNIDETITFWSFIFKGEDDALQLLKADKTQMIDSYFKGDADILLNNKANSGVSYTKGEDDALLLLKADQTLLINVYIKVEADNLLNIKIDSGVSNPKVKMMLCCS